MSPRRPRPVTPRARNRFQALTAGLTGLATFGAITATGAVAGTSARSFEAEQARKQAEEAAAQEAARRAALPTVVYVDRKRPYKTVVRTTVIERTTGVPTRPGTGGTVRATRPASSTTRPSGAGAAPAPAAAPKPPPAPAAAPKPPPAPAPTSGS